MTSVKVMMCRRKVPQIKRDSSCQITYWVMCSWIHREEQYFMLQLVQQLHFVNLGSSCIVSSSIQDQALIMHPIRLLMMYTKIRNTERIRVRKMQQRADVNMFQSNTILSQIIRLQGKLIIGNADAFIHTYHMTWYDKMQHLQSRQRNSIFVLQTLIMFIFISHNL